MMNFDEYLKDEMVKEIRQKHYASLGKKIKLSI
jgi:hypothetical protein